MLDNTNSITGKNSFYINDDVDFKKIRAARSRKFYRNMPPEKKEKRLAQVKENYRKKKLDIPRTID